MRKLAQTIRVRLVGEKVAGLVLLLLLTTYVLAKPVTASCIGPVGGQALSKEQELLRRSVLVRGCYRTHQQLRRLQVNWRCSTDVLAPLAWGYQRHRVL
jgi:hypothetical protein